MRYKGFQKDFPAPITRQEFTKLYKNYFPFGDPNKYSMYVFNHLDLNKDGLVDFVEFMTCLDISSKGTVDERLNCNLV
jgi:Ca2+-binding EF-hand superfamily protein